MESTRNAQPFTRRTLDVLDAFLENRATLDEAVDAVLADVLPRREVWRDAKEDWQEYAERERDAFDRRMRAEYEAAQAW